MSQFADVLEFIAKQGRNGDTELAHVNPQEKALLEALGGAGTRNPTTGLREYYAGADPGGGYGEGGWGGAPGSATSADGGAAGYGDTGGYGNIDGDYLSGAGTPQPAEKSWGEMAGDFFGLNNPQRAGPALATALGGSPFGLMATAGQALGQAARNAGYSVIDGAPHRDPAERAAWGAMFDGMPQGAGNDTRPAGNAPLTDTASYGVPAGLAAMPYYPGDVGLQRRMYTYAEGGQVGAGGVPQRPGLASPGASAPNAQALMAEAQRFAQQHPQQMMQVQAMIQESIQGGEVTPQQVMALVQMATLALQQPEMYPQLRAAAINQGLIEEDDLSPEFDRGMLFLLLIAGKSMSAPAQGAPAQGAPAQGAPTQGAPAQVMPSMRVGGALPARSPQPDGSIDIKAHEGEYVVPAHVVRAKGTEFFDKLVGNYSEGR
jgi:hypothetical protein